MMMMSTAAAAAERRERLLDTLTCVALAEGGLGMAWRAWVFCVPASDARRHGEFTQRLARYAVAGGAPRLLDALAAETGCLWARAALMRAALQHLPPPITEGERGCITLWVVEQRHGERMLWSMQEAQKRFVTDADARRMPLRESERERALYMFHYAKREVALRGGIGKKERRNVNGEVVCNRFVAFMDARETLRFFGEWSAAEASAAMQEKTMVFECGSYAADILRKWVIDIDIDLSKLEEGLRRAWEAPDARNAAAVALGAAVSHELHRQGFLRRPCPIAVTSRHSAGKWSWHITLCALAPFPAWRRAMSAAKVRMAADPCCPAMHAFVDEKILNNSKSQYMQILGSTKVVMGVRGTGACFEAVGLYSAAAVLMPCRAEKEHLFFAASSIMLHDPWSLPSSGAFFVGWPFGSESPGAEKKPAKRTAAEVGQTQKSRKKANHGSPKYTNLAELPAWMRRFAEARDGLTRFATIPSMDGYYAVNAERDSAMRLVAAGHARIRFYAKVVDASMCVRTLAAERRVYRHGNDRDAMLLCLEMTGSGALRMFMRCFSCKCRRLYVPASRRCSPLSSWIEVFESDLASEAVALAVAESDLKADNDAAISVEAADGWELIPARHRRGIQTALGCGAALSLGAALNRSAAELVTRADLAHAMLLSGARAVVCGSDAQLLSRRLRCPRRHPQASDDDAASIMVLESVERCSGACDYQLFVRCRCRQCRTVFVEPWVLVASDDAA